MLHTYLLEEIYEEITFLFHLSPSCLFTDNGREGGGIYSEDGNGL